MRSIRLYIIYLIPTLYIFPICASALSEQVLCDNRSHIHIWENGAIHSLSGASVCPIQVVRIERTRKIHTDSLTMQPTDRLSCQGCPTNYVSKVHIFLYFFFYFSSFFVFLQDEKDRFLTRSTVESNLRLGKPIEAR